MKSYIRKTLFTLLLAGSVMSMYSQNEVKRNVFYFTPQIGTGNFYSNLIGNIVALTGYTVITGWDCTNCLLKVKGHLIPINQLSYEYFSMDMAKSKVQIDNGNFFGFQAFDLFDNIYAGGDFGWYNKNFPIGIYGQLYYHYNHFKAKLPEAESYTKHLAHSIVPGIGLRVNFGNYEKLAYPILEAGINYYYHFKYKGEYTNLDAINDGIAVRVAMGYEFTHRCSLLLEGNIKCYDYFNTQFTPDNGQTYPYAELKSRSVDFRIKWVFRL